MSMKSINIKKRYLTKNETCHYLGISLKSLDKLMGLGKVPKIRLFSEWRFDIQDLDAFMAANKEESKEENS